MKNTSIILIVCICFTSLSVKNIHAISEKQEKARMINPLVGNPQSIEFKDLIDVSSLKLIRLETKTESIFGQIKKMHLFHDMLFIVSDCLVIFDQNGKFLLRIDKRGKGPGEYDRLTDVYYDGNHIYILDSNGQKILKYDFRGNFINSFRIGIFGMSFTKISNDVFAIYIGVDKTETSNCRLNFYSESQQKIINKKIPITDNEYQWQFISDMSNFTDNASHSNFHYSFNDTIYSLKNNSISPKFILNWGRHKMPKRISNGNFNDIMHFNESIKNKGYIYYTLGFFETDTHISFGYRLNRDTFQSIVIKSSGRTSPIKEIKNYLNLEGFHKELSYEILPRACDSNYFYSVIEPYLIEDKLQKIENLYNFKDIKVTDNVLIMKFKFK